MQENEDSAKFLGTISKPCPKCGRYLDKYAGCDHVTCKHESLAEHPLIVRQVKAVVTSSAGSASPHTEATAARPGWEHGAQGDVPIPSAKAPEHAPAAGGR